MHRKGSGIGDNLMCRGMGVLGDGGGGGVQCSAS